MDALSIVGPLIAAGTACVLQLPSVRKAWDDVRYLRPDRRKREAEFAAQFSERCGDPDVKRFAEELAYAALLGDRHLDTEERRLLLSLRDPVRTIDLYLRAFPWVRIYVSQRKFGWKKKRHESRAYRKLARAGYGLAYVAWVFFAFSPIVIQGSIHHPQHKLSNHELCFSTLYFVSIGLPLAVYCLRRVSLLGDAELLISTHNSISRIGARKR